MLRLVLAAALLLAAALAGCADAPTAEPASTTPAPVVLTDPNDTGMSTGDAPHLHDYWGGAETLVVMDAATNVGSIVIVPYKTFDFQPPDDGIVPQGTAEVEVTLSWEDGPHQVYRDPELWVRSAAEDEPQLVGALTPGEPLVVTSTNEMNDLPHQSLSAWLFQLRVYPVSDGVGFIQFESEIHVQVRAHRGLDIPLYPGHPDQWNGATEIPLFTYTHGTFFAYGDPHAGMACLPGCLDQVTPDDGAIVPTDAAIVEVTLTMGDEAATQLGLRYHGADTRAFQVAQPDTTEGKTRVYRIVVTPESGDGAYSKQSLWEFQPYIEGPMENGAHVGAYELSARVLKSATE